MKSKYINPFTDYGFKKLFGEEGSKKLLINFLNDILPIKDKIKELNFQKNEQQGDSYVSRKAIYDLFCEDEKGNQFIVEMQNAKQTYFKDRAVFYTTFPIRDQAQKGDWDFKLKAVYCVGLLGFEFEKDEVTHVYEDSLKNYRDNINVITTAKEEGREEGREEEKEQNRLKDIERVLKLLVKKFKVVDSILEKKVRTANSEKLNQIIEEILDIEDLVDVERLFE